MDKHPQKIFELVKNTYVLHSTAQAINPDSYFLRFPNEQKNRIIALPASLEDQAPVAGIKWIASFPDNIADGLDRASAVLIINDRKTGYPRACLEGSLISAGRTAASAAVGAQYLHPTPGRINRLCVVGCGLIAYQSIELLVRLGWKIGCLSVIDTSEQRGALFAIKCQKALKIEADTDLLGRAIPQSDMVLFATSAGTPHIRDPLMFRHAPTVLHMSLRDLSPEVILAAQNVVDDVDHCLKAQTSLHLTEQEVGSRNFVAGNAADLIEGRLLPDRTRTRVFSPFGMGILDLAVARAILDDISESQGNAIPDFFPVPYAA
ncbi:2,3-diaminopropionate biosynthesis protein SbnB [Noviherbaspirillum agri]